MTTSVTDQIAACWAEHDTDAVHAEALAAEVAELQGLAEVLADMERLDDERDAELLEKAKRPGNAVVHLN